MKQDQVTLSVKQSVTQNTVNDKESFTRMPTNTTYNKKKIRLTPMISPITQIKGGIKKLQTHKRKFFFQLSTDEKKKMGMEKNYATHSQTWMMRMKIKCV